MIKVHKINQAWRTEQDLDIFRDHVLTRELVEQVHQADGMETRLEGVREALYRQHREHC